MEVTSMKSPIAYIASLSTAAAIALSLVLCVPLFAEGGNASEGLAIPPGQENLLLQMLGVGKPLAGCDLVDGQVQHTSIKATYACEENNVEYRLTHRSLGGPGSTATDQ